MVALVAAQWAGGARKALHYLGSELKHSSAWLQTSDPHEGGGANYWHTGWVCGIVSATSGVAAWQLLAPVAARYDTGGGVGHPDAYQYAVVRHCGAPMPIAPGSLITTLKLVCVAAHSSCGHESGLTGLPARVCRPSRNGGMRRRPVNRRSSSRPVRHDQQL